MLDIINALNPFNFLSEMYNTKKEYEIKTKQLDNEIEIVRLQAKGMHASIDARHKEKSEELLQRRRALEGFFGLLFEQMKSISFSREEVLTMAQEAQQLSFNTSLPLDERKFYSDQSLEYVTRLPQFNVSGAQLLEGVIKTLPSLTLSSSTFQIEGK